MRVPSSDRVGLLRAYRPRARILFAAAFSLFDFPYLVHCREEGERGSRPRLPAARQSHPADHLEPCPLSVNSAGFKENATDGYLRVGSIQGDSGQDTAIRVRAIDYGCIASECTERCLMD